MVKLREKRRNNPVPLKKFASPKYIVAVDYCAKYLARRSKVQNVLDADILVLQYMADQFDRQLRYVDHCEEENREESACGSRKKLPVSRKRNVNELHVRAYEIKLLKSVRCRSSPYAAGETNDLRTIRERSDFVDEKKKNKYRQVTMSR